MAALSLPAFRPSRTFWWMVAASLAIHTLFLYGVRIKSERIDEPPRIALSATLATPKQQPETVQAAAVEPAQTIEKPAPAIKPKVKKAATKPSPKSPSGPVPIAQRPPEPPPVTAIPPPEASPPLPPSPIPEIAQTPQPSAETPPPSIASLRERSGAKIRAPEAIENPTMPAEDAPIAPPVATAPEMATPIPAIATAPHPIEPIAQERPPAAPEVETVTRTELPPPGSSAAPSPSSEAMQPPNVPKEAPSDIAKAAPSAPAPPSTATIDPDVLPLPAAGEATYKLRMGMVSGELILNWNFADRHYRLNSIAQGTGIFAIAGKYIQASEGDITTSGLRPVAFSVERRGKKDSVKFNWPENSAQFNGKSGERTEAVTLGTQDMLSLLFQLAFTPPLGEDLTVIVTNGRKLERYAFERAGEESIDLEGGTFRTLKILKQRKGDEDGMEVWLALEHHYLPVKIRVTDKKGSVIEQTLMAMKVLSVTQ